MRRWWGTLCSNTFGSRLGLNFWWSFLFSSTVLGWCHDVDKLVAVTYKRGKPKDESLLTLNWCWFGRLSKFVGWETKEARDPQKTMFASIPVDRWKNESPVLIKSDRLCQEERTCASRAGFFLLFCCELHRSGTRRLTKSVVATKINLKYFVLLNTKRDTTGAAVTSYLILFLHHAVFVVTILKNFRAWEKRCNNPKTRVPWQGRDSTAAKIQ
jgi:hypothetical protein